MKNSKGPKILFFDIETSPVLAWIWRAGPKVRIGHDQIKAGMKSDIICICWKWQGSSRVYQLDWGVKNQNSASMINEFTKEIEKADVAIAHNGVSFDVRHINTQRLLHEQRPISWPVIEDSLSQFRKYFYLPSYKLDFLAKLLAGAGKSKMVFQDWIDIVEGKSIRALEKMVKYCKKDVVLLEKVFNKAEAFFRPKTNAALIIGNERYDCPRCGSNKTIFCGYRRTLARTYRRKVCNECGTTYVGPAI